MKKLICFLLALALLSSLWACATVPVDETQGTEPPVSSAPPETDPPTESTEPSTEAPTESTASLTEPPTEPPTEADPPPTGATIYNSYYKGNMYCASDTNSYGRLTWTDLENGEQLDNVLGYYFAPQSWFDDSVWLDFENAVADPEGLFADATDRIRITHFERDWYVEFHNGKNANYIYLSEYGQYVPLRGSSDIVEYINEEFMLFRGDMLLIDPLFYFEAASPEDAAQIYCDRRAEIWTATAKQDVAEYIKCKDVSVSNISVELIEEDGTKFWVYYTVTATPLGDYPLFAGNVIENDDGSYSCHMSNVLVLDEATGKWCSESLIEFWSYT
ncbi:MAG: hypothetical protein IJ357_08605 [Oscillospiraceae bacterium]|nr:hypothetical protein [Oscillospiraceae bacterium]